jgi:hypothetical protein
MAPFGLMHIAGALVDIPYRLFHLGDSPVSVIFVAPVFYGFLVALLKYAWLRLTAESAPPIPWGRVAFRLLQASVIAALCCFAVLIYLRLT